LPGDAYGVAGQDGLDTYLTLFLDPNGWTEERFDNKSSAVISPDGKKMRITVEDKAGHYTIEMTKTTIGERPTDKKPKILRN